VRVPISPGEARFYGPKIEYTLKDAHRPRLAVRHHAGRLQHAGRLGAEYVGEDNTRKTPVMLHRAIVGSMERFIGILIEHYAGAFPLWLAPGAGRRPEHHRAPGRLRRQVRKRLGTAGLGCVGFAKRENFL
jgi:threonyl-tRNA synthetase